MPEYAEPNLTPADARRLRAFLAPRGTPGQVAAAELNGARRAHLQLRCAAEAMLRADGALLARVAPWALTARLVVRRER